MTTPAPPAFRFCCDQLSPLSRRSQKPDQPRGGEGQEDDGGAGGFSFVWRPGFPIERGVEELNEHADQGKLVATETKSRRRRRGHPARRRLGIDRVSGSGCIT